MALGVSLFCDQLPDAATTVQTGADLDAGGLDYVFVTESRNDVFTVMAQLATRTRRVRIGSAIANMYWRHPYATALATANVDNFSGGRAILGLGSGHTIAVEQFLGLTMSKPLAKMRDYVACVRAALDAGRDRIEAIGTHYQINGARVQWPTTNRTPIVLAALSPGMLTLGVTLGDGVITSLAPLRQLREFRALIDDATVAAGKQPSDVTLFAVIHCVIRPTREEAYAIARNGITYARLGYYARTLATYGIDSTAGVFTDDALDQIAIVGTVDDAKAKLAEFRAAGVDVPLLGPMASAPDPVAEYHSFLALRDR